MELPPWSALTGAQREVFETPLDQSLFVAGPPGSGKTVLAIRRAQAVSANGERVLLLTYNRMLRRAARLLDDTADIEVATMHQHCWHDYQRRTQGTPPCSRFDGYDWHWPEMLQALRGHARAGTTHDHLVIDEAQDLPAGFFEYARRHIAPRMSVFADENQSVDRHCSTLEQIKAWGCLPDPETLGDNHRSTPEIVAVANHFHGGRLPVPRVHRPSQDELPRLVRHACREDTCEMIARWYGTYGGSIGVVVQQAVTGQCLYDILGRDLSARVDFYTNDRSNEDTIELFAPGVTILTDRSVKGQEYDTLFLLELERFVPCQGEVQRRMMYMICSRPREHLIMVYGPGKLARSALAALPGAALLERS